MGPSKRAVRWDGAAQGPDMLAIPEALLVGEPRDGNPQWFRLHDLARSRIEDGHVWTESAVNQVVSKRLIKNENNKCNGR